MATEVLMPKMGYDMEEGTILQWRKAEGDTVAKGDILAEIETGKVTIEIEAFDAGVLRALVVKEGQTVAVGTPIAIIGTADEPITLPKPPENGAKEQVAGTAVTAAAAPPAGASLPATELAEAMPAPPADPGAPAISAAQATPPVAEGDDGRLRASPLARRMAGEAGLDLRLVGTGSGPGGRIVRDDVETAIANPPALTAPAAGLAPGAQPRESRREPLSGVRRTIAKRLTQSWQAAPHIFVTMAVEMDAALALRAQINDVMPEDGLKISLNDLIVKAAARTLTEHPLLNVSWADGGERVVHGQVNIGVAVALDDGLMTVTIADADRKSLSAVALEIRDKAERARAGKLTAADLNVPSTFTISNMGMFGVETFTAIINPPEAAILAVGAAAPEAVVRDGELAVATVMRLTLSADHRVVDGAAAAQFLGRVKELLEHPAAALA